MRVTMRSSSPSASRSLGAGTAGTPDARASTPSRPHASRNAGPCGVSPSSLRISWTYWCAISCFRTSTTTLHGRSTTRGSEISRVRVAGIHRPRVDVVRTSSSVGAVIALRKCASLSWRHVARSSRASAASRVAVSADGTPGRMRPARDTELACAIDVAGSLAEFLRAR